MPDFLPILNCTSGQIGPNCSFPGIYNGDLGCGETLFRVFVRDNINSEAMETLFFTDMEKQKTWSVQGQKAESAISFLSSFQPSVLVLF